MHTTRLHWSHTAVEHHQTLRPTTTTTTTIMSAQEVRAGRGARLNDPHRQESQFDIYEDTFDMLVSQLEDEELGGNLSSIFGEVLVLLKKGTLLKLE
jgi:hypothetical protein